MVKVYVFKPLECLRVSIFLTLLCFLGMGHLAKASASSFRMCSQIFASDLSTAPEKYLDLQNKIAQLPQHQPGSRELAILRQEILNKVENALRENGIAHERRGSIFKILPAENNNLINIEVLKLWKKNPHIKVLYRPLLNEWPSYEATKSELLISTDILIYNRITSTLIHEGRHADLHTLFLEGKDSIFHGFIFANAKTEFSKNLGYNKHFSFEELSTFAIDTFFEIQALRKNQNTQSEDDVIYYVGVLNSLARATIRNIPEFKKPLLSLQNDTTSWKAISWKEDGDTQSNATYWGFKKDRKLVTFTSDSQYGPGAVKIWIRAFSGNQIMLSAQRSQFNSYASLRTLVKKQANQNSKLEELPPGLTAYLDYFNQRIEALYQRAQQIQNLTDVMLDLYYGGHREAAFEKAAELERLGYDEGATTP